MGKLKKWNEKNDINGSSPKMNGITPKLMDNAKNEWTTHKKQGQIS